ncbi:MAG: Crp/Fnr family transcriptional regulator [Anaerovoracaceae bacterium]
MKKNEKILRACPLFEGISDQNLSAMIACLGARTVSAARGEMIFREGEPARYMGLMLSGSGQIIREDYFGNRTILARIEAGDLFGESFACAGLEALPVSVAASEDCTYMLFDCRRLTTSCTSACEFHSRLIFNLLQIVAAKNLVFHQKIEITSKRTTRDKLMTYLLMQAKAAGSRSFTVPYDRQELADYLEVDRSGLSAEISKLRKEGVLECRKNEFFLK